MLKGTFDEYTAGEESSREVLSSDDGKQPHQEDADDLCRLMCTMVQRFKVERSFDKRKSKPDCRFRKATDTHDPTQKTLCDNFRDVFPQMRIQISVPNEPLTCLILLDSALQKKYATFERSFDRRLAGEPDSYEMSSSDDGKPQNEQDQEDEDAEDKR